jgi:hypothetical protein
MSMILSTLVELMKLRRKIDLELNHILLILVILTGLIQ